ncbi:hypothetical protein MLD38_019413 [Melastoma candidum]|uniref:Uncharacterized protein n=1 Tax=Melastoma candidum TaxID=119954 RepID=A0ACB9QY79_9MYRT|nr:hypothetical protein MLD38_019413 [Melastoma candidum]
MTHLLFLALLLESSLILFLLFKTPLRKLSILSLDRLKRGRGPVVVKTVCGTLLVLLGSGVRSMAKIRGRGSDDSPVGPTDQVLMARHMLETTLLGAILFLALMIDRLHHYIRELRLRRKGMEAAKTAGRGLEDGKANSLEDIKRSLEEETRALREKVECLEADLAAKAKDVNTAKASAIALRKQSEGFLLEYDRLLEENQNLRRQLQVLDRRLSYSGTKKNS